MPVLSGPVMALMALLTLAGFYKIQDPSPTAGALRAAGLPHSERLVRLLGLVEIAIGAAWLVQGSAVTAIAGAVVYGGFAWFVVNALRRRLPISSCGCLGATDTPPTKGHIVVNVLATITLLAAAVIPVGPLGGLAGQGLDVVVPYVLFTLATVYLLYAVIAVLPERTALSRETTIELSPTRLQSGT